MRLNKEKAVFELCWNRSRAISGCCRRNLNKTKRKAGGGRTRSKQIEHLNFALQFSNSAFLEDEKRNDLQATSSPRDRRENRIEKRSGRVEKGSEAFRVSESSGDQK